MSKPIGSKIFALTCTPLTLHAGPDPLLRSRAVKSWRNRSLVTSVLSMLAIALVNPAGIVRAQTGGTSNSVTVSSSTATGIALGTAAQYRVKHATSWDAYEDIMIPKLRSTFLRSQRPL